jgi:AraC-like DNA-binding protein
VKPSFEKIPIPTDASWSMLNRRLPDEIPFEWHHHPEYELTLTLNSRGHRYVSNDVRLYDDGDLVLLGPNVPHSWCSGELIDTARPHVALVIWFSRAWADSLVSLFPEMGSLQALLAAAQCAVHFSDQASNALRPVIEAMVEQQGPERLVSLLHVLTQLSRDTAAQRIISDPVTEAVSGAGEDARLQRVLDHLHAHYAEPLTIPELAGIACISVSAFHRMFRRHTHCTALDYIARLRIGRACAMLLQGTTAISLIGETVGYSSLALFNRQFKAQKCLTPSAYRKCHGHHFR